MIFFENGLGLLLAGKLRDRSLVERWARWIRLLHNSSLVFRNSSLACTCPSITARDASISAIKRFCKSSCSAQASACNLSCSSLASTHSLSCSALASSWIHSWIRSFSRLWSSLASCRALMASMSYCKTGASLPSEPCRPCLVFLITSESSITNADGIKFYHAPRWAPNVLAS